MKIGKRTAAAIFIMLSTTAFADTPKDTFVMAKDIGDMISLDPAEVFEQSGTEIIGNLYDRIMVYDSDDINKLTEGVAESHKISEDGKTIVLSVRPGLTFHSGNPVTAEDVAFSLRRVIKLKKTPSFILSQFGWTPENVDEKVTVLDERRVQMKFEGSYSPSLILNALASGVGSVVDRLECLKYQMGNDLGYGWLKTHSAGSGAYSLASWKANEIVTLKSFPTFRKGEARLARVVVRHVPESSAQRLLLEKGDVDMARNITPDQMKGMSGNQDVAVVEYPKAAILYVGLNGNDPLVGQPGVQRAFRYLVDYRGMVGSFLAGQFKVHQSFWPSGLWASNDSEPFALDLQRAKDQLSKANLPAGPKKVTIDTFKFSPFPEIAQTLQQNLKSVGIDAEIILSEGKTFWPKYRARKHSIVVARYAPDYIDPHSNADAFAHNPDNSDAAQLTGKLAWRNSWQDKAVNEMVEQAAREPDAEKRKSRYVALQERMQGDSPYTFMFQMIDQVAMRRHVKGFVNGPLYDLVYYRNLTK